MKTIVEIFTYQVPDDCDNYVEVMDYINEIEDHQFPAFYVDEDDPFNSKYVPDYDRRIIEYENDN